MLFNSLSFCLFFPVVTALYFLLPHRFPWAMLLAASALAFFVPPAAAALAVSVDAWELTLILVAVAAALLGAVFPLVSHSAIAPDARAVPGTGARGSGADGALA